MCGPACEVALATSFMRCHCRVAMGAGRGPRTLSRATSLPRRNAATGPVRLGSARFGRRRRYRNRRNGAGVGYGALRNGEGRRNASGAAGRAS